MHRFALGASRRFSLITSLLVGLLAATTLGCRKQEQPEPPTLDRAKQEAKRAVNELSAKTTSLIERAAQSLDEAGHRLRNATADQARSAVEDARKSLEHLQDDVEDATRRGVHSAAKGAKEGGDSLTRDIEELSAKLKTGLDRVSHEAEPAAQRTRREIADGLEQLRDKLRRLKDRVQ